MKRIDFETHFVTQEWVEALIHNKGYPRLIEDKAANTRRMYFTENAAEPFSEILLGRLLDVGKERLNNMDAAGIDVQVLSLTAPGIEHFDPEVGAPLAENVNNTLAEIISKHPDRFSGYATLAVKDTVGACRELERAVKELGLKGWKTHSNYGDSYLDEER
jgi:predicted TIM-barrel fold metal-dependent hydrolase